MKRLILALFVTVSLPSHADDIWKCVDVDGHASYQAMPCNRRERATPITGTVNTLPMALPDAAKRKVDALRKARNKLQRDRLRRRNRRLQHFLDKYHARQEECRQLTEQYRRLQDQHYAQGDPSTAHNRLVKQIHIACST